MRSAASCTGKLLTLLDVTVTTDVLSGTSAGGINAALLGLASVTGADLGGLRDLWLTTGSMDMLLRDPGEPNPPSLMQGDKVLFSQLNRGIRISTTTGARTRFESRDRNQHHRIHHHHDDHR